MTRPDSGSPDQSANQDDAVWLDLVARLEGKSPDGSSTADGGPAPAALTIPIVPAIPPKTALALTRGPGPPWTPLPTRPDGPRLSATLTPWAWLAGPPWNCPRPTGWRPPPGPQRRPSAPARMPAPGIRRDGQAAGPRDYDVEDDGGDFVPEEPPSLSGTDPLTMLAWLGAVGAPLALLLSVMFWRSAPLLAILGMVAAFILAVVYLIMKLPQEKDENDDGARVELRVLTAVTGNWQLPL